MGADTVKIYCPKCSQVYHPPAVRSRTGNASGVDGAAFGTTFPHLFLMTFSNLVPDPLPADSTYVPRVFGFRVHKSARQRFNQPSAVVAAVLPESNAAKSEEATNLNSADDKKGSAEEDDDSKSAPPAVEANNNSSPNNIIASTDAAAAGATSTAGGTQSGAGGAQLSEAGAGTDEKRARTGVKRSRKETAPAVAEGSATKKESNGLAVPTFLMENAVKRRRRNVNTTNNTT
jgi:Casein kinase II regulatory subunit